MRKPLLVLITVTTLTAFGASPSGADRWLRQIGGGGPDLVYDLAATADGRLCAAGTFWATVTFGDGAQSKTLSTDGTQDIFVACLDEAGNLSSVTQFGTHRGDEVRAIAALPAGDVVITGYFTRRFGSEPQSALQARDSADIFVARLDRDGQQVWARRIGGAGADSGAALSVTANGDILLAGNFSGTMTFPTDDRVSKLNSAGAADAFVMRMTSDGDVLWARRIGGGRYDQANAVYEAPDRQVIVAGIFDEAAATEGLADTVRSRGYNDVFVASFDADGTPSWLRGLGGPRQDTLNGLVVDRKGGIHLTGTFQGDFETGQTSLASEGSSDVFVTRLGAGGEVQHAHSLGSPHTEQVFDLALHGDELIYTGHFQGETDFAPGEAVELRNSARTGDSNAFVLILDRDAGFRAVQTYGDIGVEIGFAVATLHKRRGIAIAGVFNKGFNPRIEGLDLLDNRGKSDVFVLHNPIR